MAQAGAQREPSMEEILASIRRIIESNEPGAQPIDIHEDDEPSEADETGHAAESAAQRSPAPSAAHAAPSHAAPSAYVSLADVAARVRAESASLSEESRTIDAADLMRQALLSDEPEAEVETPAMQSVPEVQSVQPTRISLSRTSESFPPAQQPRPQAVSAMAEPAPFRPEPATVSPEPVAAKPQQVAMKSEPVAVKPEPVKVEPAAARPEPVASHQEQAAPAADEAEASQSAGQLVSFDVGAKVAASFDHLTAALAASNSRGFDEIAEELLKPMLQNWLDDNLPTLVERLVREEIERVSRGTRR